MPFIHKTNNSYYSATIQQLGGVFCFHKPKGRSMSLPGVNYEGKGYGVRSRYSFLFNAQYGR